MDETSLIVIGSLNTDIIGTGLKRFPEPGQLVWGKELKIGPGGKSRNIAAMAGLMLPAKRVAMIGRTVQDKFGLWKPPIDALHQAGVNTDFVRVLPADQSPKMPAIAMIPVNIQGSSKIMLFPGVSVDFDCEDIDAADELFETVSQNKGFFALTMECPFDTAKYAVQKAADLGIKVVLDPGGLEPYTRVDELIKTGVYLIKPNEHEAQMITGMEVTDVDSARIVANKLKELGAQNVLITHGEHGAYLFTNSQEMYIPVPSVRANGNKDATGCGDQTMATLCVYLQLGLTLEEAAPIAVLSGTLQFHKVGIQPITKTELDSFRL